MSDLLFKKNARGWKPTDNDYRLVFRFVDDSWREISGNVPRYNCMCLADYLSDVEIDVPDGCTFMRIKRDDLDWEYRDFGTYIRIDALIK